jgi:tRNA A37 methylthiotransferase MiaB
MPQKVVLTELNLYEEMVPLTSGYLETYAKTDPAVSAGFTFSTYTQHVDVDENRLYADLARRDADVYGFSCYVWNMGAIKRVAERLARDKPSARIVLGGHQAANHGERYLPVDLENMVVCNGEGEQTFRSLLSTLQRNSDLAEVRGLSFRRDGRLITTAAQPKLEELDVIPSPFLDGVFEPRRYALTVFETNRGCPYQCSFCTWGGPGLTVTKFSLDRVLAELEWIARAGVFFIYIADANWGMLSRDIEISKFIGAMHHKHNAPRMVYYAAAKNKPHGTVQCIEAFHEAGVITAQAVGVQSMNEKTLATIKRSNIKNSKFLQMYEQLAGHDISSYSELMFPLPDETYASLLKTVRTLCELGTGGIIIYPIILINNAELTARRDEWGLVSVPSSRPVDECEFVVATNTVTREEYEDSLWFFYAGVHPLYNARLLACTASLVSRTGRLTCDALFEAFARYVRAHREFAYSRELDSLFASGAHYDHLSLGSTVHSLLHDNRADCLDMVIRFARSQPWWADEQLRVAVELDLVNAPYIYSNTPLEVPQHGWEFVDVSPHGGRELDVELRKDLGELVGQLLHPAKLRGTPGRRFRVSHRGDRLPFGKHRTARHNANYCHGMIQRANQIMPTWHAL